MSKIHIASNLSQSTFEPFSDNQVQPNALDVRLHKVYRWLTTAGRYSFLLGIEEKIHHPTREVQLILDTNHFYLDPGAYEVLFEGNVSIADGEMGYVVPRSTLVRNGCTLISGLYDSGYNGVVGAQLVVSNPTGAKIEQGARIGQFVLETAQALHTYKGSYGTASEYDEKYK